MRLDPLLTCSPITGAVRHVIDGLLRDTYLAPTSTDFEIAAALEERSAPWSASLEVAQEETAKAIEAGLIDLMRATRTLRSAELRPDLLPKSRAESHFRALADLWRDMGDALPKELATIRHVLESSATDALEPLPLLEAAICPFSNAVERSLAETLIAHHGVASATARSQWLQRQSSREGAASGALGNVQRQLTRIDSPAEVDDSLQVFGLRDPNEEADFAAARVQRMLDDGPVDGPAEIGVLTPDDDSYLLSLRSAFDRLGLPLSGLPAAPSLRDPAGELLSALVAILQGPAPRTAVATLCSSPLMPWSPEIGCRITREIMDRGWSRTAQKLDEAGRAVLDALHPVASSGQLIARLFAISKALPGEPVLAPRIAEIRASLGDEIDWPMVKRLAAPRHVSASGHDRFVEGVSLFTEAALPWRPVRQLIVLGLAGRQWPRPVAANPFFTESEIRLVRERTGLAIVGRRERLARGLELFRRQLCAATDGATLLVPARDLAGDHLPASTALSLIARAVGLDDPEKLVRDVRAEPATTWPVTASHIDPYTDGGAPELPHGGLLHLGSDLLRLRPDQGGRLSSSVAVAAGDAARQPHELAAQ